MNDQQEYECQHFWIKPVRVVDANGKVLVELYPGQTYSLSEIKDEPRA